MLSEHQRLYSRHATRNFKPSRLNYFPLLAGAGKIFHFLIALLSHSLSAECFKKVSFNPRLYPRGKLRGRIDSDTSKSVRARCVSIAEAFATRALYFISYQAATNNACVVITMRIKSRLYSQRFKAFSERAFARFLLRAALHTSHVFGRIFDNFWNNARKINYSPLSQRPRVQNENGAAVRRGFSWYISYMSVLLGHPWALSSSHYPWRGFCAARILVPAQKRKQNSRILKAPFALLDAKRAHASLQRQSVKRTKHITGSWGFFFFIRGNMRINFSQGINARRKRLNFNLFFFALRYELLI